MSELAEVLLKEARDRFTLHAETCEDCRDAGGDPVRRCSFGGYLVKVYENYKRNAGAA